MSEGFDAYRKWLGIPPEDQPPHHYRLLGIAVFEDDPDVIENAANRQMTHVRTFQSGRNAELSQKILNELSSARICLLNADKKAAYDAALKEQLRQEQEDEAPPPAAAPPPKAPPPKAAPPRAAVPPPQAVAPPPLAGGVAVAALPVATAIPVAAPRPVVGSRSPTPARKTGFPSAATSSYSKRSPSRRKSSPWPLLLGIVAVVLLVGLVAAVSNFSKQGKEKAQAEGVGRGNGTSVSTGSGGSTSGTTTPQPRPRPTEPSQFTRPEPEPLDTFTPPPPKPNRTEEPRPRPQPSSGETFAHLIKQAMEQLGQRNREDARTALYHASQVSESLEQKNELEHATQILYYLDDFAQAVNRSLQRLKADLENEKSEPFMFADRPVRLIKMDGERIVFAFGDDEVEISLLDLKPRHAVAFASRSLDFEDPTAKVRVAAFLALDRDSTDGDKERAVMLLKEAARQGLRDEHLAWLLKFPVHELPEADNPFQPKDPDGTDGPDRPFNPDRPNSDRPIPDRPSDSPQPPDAKPPFSDDDDPFGLKEFQPGGSKPPSSSEKKPAAERPNATRTPPEKEPPAEDADPFGLKSLRRDD